MNMNTNVKKILSIAATIQENESEIARLHTENKQLALTLDTMVSPTKRQKPKASKKIEDSLVRAVKGKETGKRSMPPKRSAEEYEKAVLKAVKRPAHITEILRTVRTAGPTARKIIGSLMKRGLIRETTVEVEIGQNHKMETTGWVAA